MNFLVIVVAVVAIILVFLSKIYNLSIVYPTLVIILAVVLDILVNAINDRKNKKENNSLYKEKEDKK